MPEERLELIPKDLIRVETALSRFPIHRLAKQGNVSIEIKEANANGELKTKWEVTYNSKYGQPGPLAYKVDSLIINRKIEESGKPVPALIKLGSLKEICNQLGLGQTRDTNRVRNALRQNASAFVTAKISYKQTNGTERTVEADFNRYSVVCTGETMPDGSRADSVYLVLNNIYAQILNSAQTRPLDYDYLKDLPPAPQRLYELLSFQMYAAIKYHHPHAKLLYSEYCTYAPQTRYSDYDHVKKQMYKVHRPHIESGYIEKVSFEEVRNDDSSLDWMMLYKPGPKARGEHLASQKKLRSQRLSTKQKQIPLPDPAPAPAADHAAESLISKLKGFGIGEERARGLVKIHREAAEAQIAAYPYREEGKPKKNAAGWLIAAIEGNYTLPVAYLEERERKQQAAKAREGKTAIESCQFCDSNGWRRIRTPEYPNGAMKRCTHNAETEAKYTSV
jgi:hypothetical protein